MKFRLVEYSRSCWLWSWNEILLPVTVKGRIEGGVFSLSGFRCKYNKSVKRDFFSYPSLIVTGLTAGFDSSSGVVMGSLSSCHPQVTLLAMKQCCRERSWSWNTVRIRPQRVTCWGPQSHWARQLSLQHLWTPARYAVCCFVMENMLVHVLSRGMLVVNSRHFRPSQLKSPLLTFFFCYCVWMCRLCCHLTWKGSERSLPKTSMSFGWWTRLNLAGRTVQWVSGAEMGKDWKCFQKSIIINSSLMIQVASCCNGENKYEKDRKFTT